MRQTLFLGVLCALACTARGQGLFPPTLSVEYGRPAAANSTANAGYVCNFAPKLLALAPSRAVLVQLGDDWQSIAIRQGVSLQKLLRFNFIFPGDLETAAGLAAPPSLVPGTFVIVDRPPSVAPECACPGSYSQISDDESMCNDLVTGASMPRLLPTARIAALVTAGISAAFWVPNATFSQTTDLLIDLQMVNELFEVDLSLTRASGSIALVQVAALSAAATISTPSTTTTATTSSTTTSITSSASLLRQYPDIAWSTIVTFAPASQQQQLCTIAAGVCADLVRGFSVGKLPLLSDGRPIVATSALRFRFFFDPTEIRPIQVDGVVASGRCDCSGHATSCWATTAAGPRVCQCNHFTMGARCEQCQPLYNRKLWQRGTNTNANPCLPCECNGHATSCTYNASLDTLPGSSTLGGGGLCVRCDGFTTGAQCEMCLATFYHPTSSQLSDDCLPCGCNVAGQLNGDCQKLFTATIPAGQCFCKSLAMGLLCDQCVPGSFNLSVGNALGCQPCACDPYGAFSGNCTDPAGQCACKAGTMGVKCNVCKPGMWDLRAENPDGCRPCLLGGTPNTFMYSDASNVCRYCDTECLQCTGPGPNNCTQCRNYVFNTTCVNKCPALFYPDSNNICRPCNDECAIGCSGPSAAECTACKRFVLDVFSNNSATLNSCVPRCPAMYFIESQTRRCMMCNDLCSDGCSGPLPSQCTACKYVALGQTCLASCPAGSYANSVNICKACHVQCRDTCRGPLSSDCDACLNYNNTLTSQCVAQCPLALYADDQAQCRSCNNECLSACYGPNATQCAVFCTQDGCLPTCKRALLVTPSGRTCVPACPSSQYLDLRGQCQPCNSECNGCTGPDSTSCIACANFQMQGTCYASCPLATYASPNMTCLPCNIECVRGCAGPSSSECTACAHVNVSGRCVYSCPSFTYLEPGGNNCLPCSSECSTGCFGPLPSQCLNNACRRFTLDGQCVAACPVGTLPMGTVCQRCPFGNYFLDPATGNCSTCNTECTGGCSGPLASQCLGPCKNYQLSVSTSPAGLITNTSIGTSAATCVAMCPAMFYTSFDRQCYGCSNLCAGGCSGPTPSSCTACASHKYFGECVQDCPPGYYGGAAVDCAACHPECLTCYAGGQLYCDICKHVRDPILGCIASCAADKWPVASATGNETLCMPCRSVPGMVLDNGVCKPTCPVGSYPDSSFRCQPCDSRCATGTTCLGPGPANCSACQTAQLSSVCVAACPIPTYLDSQRICQPCNLLCNSTFGCTGPTTNDCVECAANTYRYPVSAPLGPACRGGQTCGRCVSECPGVLTQGVCALTCSSFEYLAANRSCMACDSLCAQGCVAAGPLGCAGGLCRGPKLPSGECVAACPAMSAAVQGMCQPCDAQCLSGCTGPSASQCAGGLCVNARRVDTCLSRCPIGEYYLGTAQSICQLCEPGYFCPDGQSRQPCSSTTYQPIAGASRCSACPPNSICVMDLRTGLYTSFVCITGYVTALNGTPCAALDKIATTPAASAALQTLDDEQSTAAIASIVAVATALIVVLSVYAIVRLRSRNRTAAQFRDVAPLHKLHNDPVMNSLPLPALAATPHQRTSFDETYM